MEYVELGVFILVLAFAGFFTIVTIGGEKQGAVRAAFRLLAMALFMGLAGMIGGGYAVAQTHTNTQTITNAVTGESWTGTDTYKDIVIPGGMDSYWLAWLFVAFGFMNLIFLVREFAQPPGAS